MCFARLKHLTIIIIGVLRDQHDVSTLPDLYNGPLSVLSTLEYRTPFLLQKSTSPTNDGIHHPNMYLTLKKIDHHINIFPFSSSFNFKSPQIT